MIRLRSRLFDLAGKSTDFGSTELDKSRDAVGQLEGASVAPRPPLTGSPLGRDRGATRLTSSACVSGSWAGLGWGAACRCDSRDRRELDAVCLMWASPPSDTSRDTRFVGGGPDALEVVVVVQLQAKRPVTTGSRWRIGGWQDCRDAPQLLQRFGHLCVRPGRFPGFLPQPCFQALSLGGAPGQLVGECGLVSAKFDCVGQVRDPAVDFGDLAPQGGRIGDLSGVQLVLGEHLGRDQTVVLVHLPSSARSAWILGPYARG